MSGSWDELTADEIDLGLRRHLALNDGVSGALTPGETAAYLLEVMSVRRDIAQRLGDPGLPLELRAKLTALDQLLRRRIPQQEGNS